MTTLRESYRSALERRGWKRDHEARSKKFWVMRRQDKERAIYLGKGGSVRWGKTIDTSFPASDSFKADLLKDEGRVASDFISAQFPDGIK